MPISYQKWDMLDDCPSSDSASDAECIQPRLRGRTTRLPNLRPGDLCKNEQSTLVTVPWDPLCEKTRWALDMHGIGYIEHAWPWGLHLWATLPLSEPTPKRQVTRTPVLETSQKEVFRRNTTDILLWLFSRSLCSTTRIYADPKALEYEQFFDSHLAPAAQLILYHTLLSSPQLTKKYLIDTIHLTTHKTAFCLAWPWIIKPALKRHFRIGNPAALEDAWEKVYASFEKVTQVLGDWNAKRAHKSRYLCGNAFTAADLTFGAYAEFVIFPNEKDFPCSSEHIPIRFPSVSELPPDVRSHVAALRRTPAGQFALYLYRKERGQSSGTRPSKYARSAQPWWSEYEVLRDVVYGSLLGTAFVTALVFLLLPTPIANAILIVAGSAAVQFVAWSDELKGTRERAKRLWFVMTGNPEEAPLQSSKGSGKSGKKMKSAFAATAEPTEDNHLFRYKDNSKTEESSAGNDDKFAVAGATSILPSVSPHTESGNSNITVTLTDTLNKIPGSEDSMSPELAPLPLKIKNETKKSESFEIEELDPSLEVLNPPKIIEQHPMMQRALHLGSP